MSGDESVELISLVGFLVLVASALAIRRAPIGTLVRSLIGWVVIGGIVWFAIANRPQIEALLADVGERMGIADQQVDGDTVRITMSGDGHFWARVVLDGHPVRMLVDSGATITAISEDTAKAAGIEVSESGFPVALETANGRVSARRARARQGTLGSLKTEDLGVVVSPAFDDTNVLGMNFLTRLGSWRVEGRTLVLEPKRQAGSKQREAPSDQ